MAEIIVGNYGQERDVNATTEEMQIFSELIFLISGAGQDIDPIELKKKSGSYVAACIGATDIMRFKFTDRAKWIQLPYSADDKDKRPINAPADINQYKREIMAHYHLALANKLLGY